MIQNSMNQMLGVAGLIGGYAGKLRADKMNAETDLVNQYANQSYAKGAAYKAKADKASEAADKAEEEGNADLVGTKLDEAKGDYAHMQTAKTEHANATKTLNETATSWKTRLFAPMGVSSHAAKLRDNQRIKPGLGMPESFADEGLYDEMRQASIDRAKRIAARNVLQANNMFPTNLGKVDVDSDLGQKIQAQLKKENK